MLQYIGSQRVRHNLVNEQQERVHTQEGSEKNGKMS